MNDANRTSGKPSPMRYAPLPDADAKRIGNAIDAGADGARLADALVGQDETGALPLHPPGPFPEGYPNTPLGCGTGRPPTVAADLAIAAAAAADAAFDATPAGRAVHDFTSETPKGERTPPNRATIGRLLKQATAAEGEAATLEAHTEGFRQDLADASRRAKDARSRAEKLWAVVTIAIRCHALAEPMPTEAELDAAGAAWSEEAALREGLVVPETAKHGDIIRSTTTGRYFRITEHNGELYAWPVEK